MVWAMVCCTRSSHKSSWGLGHYHHSHHPVERSRRQKLNLDLDHRPPPQRHNVQKSGKISHYLQVFIYPRWLFGISSINSNMTMENSSHEDVSPIFQHGDFPPIAVLGFQGPGCTFFCETTGKDMERLDLFFDLLRLSFHTVFIQGRSPTSWAL